MKKVDRATFFATVEAAEALLDQLIEEDKEGATTALSYVRFRVDDLGDAVAIVAWNDGFVGDPTPRRSILGWVDGDDGYVPVVLVERDRGIVNGTEALGPVFDLFEYRAGPDTAGKPAAERRRPKARRRERHD